MLSANSGYHQKQKTTCAFRAVTASSSYCAELLLVQTPPDQCGSQPAHIQYADAIRRFREVHYDRGTIVNSIDIEAKDMADC